MGTIDNNGVYFYETTDAISPLQTLLNVGQQSVSDSLDSTARIFPVPNTAERTALTALRPPSPTDPLIVYRGDTKRVEVSDGTGWNPVGGLSYISVPRSASYVMGSNSTMYVLGGSGSGVPVFGTPVASDGLNLSGTTYSNETFSWNTSTCVLTPVQPTGMYEIEFRMQASPVGTGTTTIGIVLNGTSIGATSNDLARDDRANTSLAAQYLYAKTPPVRLVAGNQIRFITFLFGVSGAVTAAADPNQTWFKMTRLGA